MDAKPHRPRAVRVHDENMPATTIMGGQHHLLQRTKSASVLPTFSANVVKAHNKKVLGEANKNLSVKVGYKDDSEIGKVSPGKMKSQLEADKAVRPSAPLRAYVFSHNTSANAVPLKQQSAAVGPELAPKKSTKVLKDTVGSTFQKPAKASAAIPIIDPATNFAVQHQDTRTGPVRDGAAVADYGRSGATAVADKYPNGTTASNGKVTHVEEYQHLDIYSHINGHGTDSALLNLTGHGKANDHQVIDALPQTLGDATAYSDLDEVEYEDDNESTAAGEYVTDMTITLLNPLFTEKELKLIAAARMFVEATRTVEEIEDELWDTSMVAEYGDDIFRYMRELEARLSPNPFYMDIQTEIRWEMRTVLVEWVVQVHQRFNLLPETLFLAVNYIDRFLSAKVVSLGKLQLVGATAIFLAAKYEEVNCPTISEIIFMVDGGYSSDELVKAERFMLNMLSFEMGWPGPMSFLRRISKADDYDLETRTLAKYFLEVTLIDSRFVGLLPSYLAAGAHCMARLMLRKGDWTPAHVFYSNYTFGQLKKLLHVMLNACETARQHHPVVFEKYADRRFKRASTFVEAEITKGFEVPRVGRDGSMGVYSLFAVPPA